MSFDAVEEIEYCITPNNHGKRPSDDQNEILPSCQYGFLLYDQLWPIGGYEQLQTK